jgi:hypothetical protein
MAKGFGKADQLIEQRKMLARIRNAPPEDRARADAMADPANLSLDDFCYIAKDISIMCSVFVEHELSQFEGQGGHFHVEEDGTVTGLTFLKHLATGENVGVVLRQTEPATPDYQVAEVFTTNASGITAVPDSDLDAAGAVANETLNKQALAYSFTYDGAQRGMMAGYAWTGGHVEEKVKATTPDGCVAVKPFPVSNHPTTVRAITFAHCLNKSVGVLFGGRSYKDLQQQLGRE